MTKQDYVVGFLYSKDRSRVALICKSKPDWQKGLWNGIGGKVEQGESWEEAMAREFQEEAGVTITDWEHTVTLYNDGYELRVFRAFSDLIDEVRTMEKEPVDVVPLSDLSHSKVIPNLRWLIPLQCDQSVYFPLCPILND